MKKLFGLLIMALLVLASCQKEQFEPREMQTSDCTCVDGKAAGSSDNNDAGDDFTRPITDPNGDEDEDKRPKKANKQ